MILSRKERLKRIFDYLVVFASLVLLVAISVEILARESPLHIDEWYIHLQLAICTLFITDFFISMSNERDKKRYFWSHILILIISIPYLSLPYEKIMPVDHNGRLLIALIPILRSYVAIYILLRWLIRGQIALRLLYAYILSLISFTYVSALIFYECEAPLNSDLHTFGDAIWWAAMALTTTELTITPITATAKVLAVILPMSGMMLLPIATNYLFSMRNKRDS